MNFMTNVAYDIAYVAKHMRMCTCFAYDSVLHVQSESAKMKLASDNYFKVCLQVWDLQGPG